MRYGKTAALTGNLLFPKGSAETGGFLLSRQPPPVMNQIPLRKPATAQAPAPRPVMSQVVPSPSPMHTFTPMPRQFHTQGPVRHSIMLDRERHLRLKLASVKLNTSGRELILAAIDHYFSTVVPARLGSACPCLMTDPTTEAICGGDNCRVVTEPQS
jgi:hypothetical protein